jgi:hypothetical protein
VPKGTASYLFFPMDVKIARGSLHSLWSGFKRCHGNHPESLIISIQYRVSLASVSHREILF